MKELREGDQKRRRSLPITPKPSHLNLGKKKKIAISIPYEKIISGF
jgi:hypothetical protein